MTGGFKSFGSDGNRLPVLVNFTLSTQPGMRLCLMGPNACGKSTLVHTLLGLEKLDAGVLDYQATAEDRAAAVLQDYRRQLLPWASVMTNLLLPLKSTSHLSVCEEEMINSAEAFWRRLGYRISLEQRVGTLSGGQQQSLVIARAISFAPNLWILDEALSAIDLARRSEVGDVLVAHCGARMALFVTHDLDDALRLGTRLIIVGTDMRISSQFDIERPGAMSASDFLTSEYAVAIRKRVLLTLSDARNHTDGKVL